MEDRRYSDWFGSGDTKEDVANAIEKHGQPDSIFYQASGWMASLVYDDKVVTVGYDGSGHSHTFVTDEPVNPVAEAMDALKKAMAEEGVEPGTYAHGFF